jgi:hypothetical protein
MLIALLRPDLPIMARMMETFTPGRQDPPSFFSGEALHKDQDAVCLHR